MQRRFFILLAGVALALGLTACSSLETSKNFNGMGFTASRTRPIAHINARVDGVFLFDVFPLFCGSVNNVDKVAAFVNTVSLDNTMGMVTREARGMGATKVVDVTSYYYSRWLWYTLILWSRQMQVSATAVK
jgi:hypothetical protein